MPLKTDGIDEPELNLTPMIDIVFLLIIFFLVGTEFAEDKSIEDESTQLPIELPTTSTQAALTPGPDPVLVSITREGEIYIGQKQLTLPELKKELDAAKKNYEDIAVVIAGDGSTHLQVVVDVMEICKEIPIKRTRIKAKTTGQTKL